MSARLSELDPLLKLEIPDSPPDLEVAGAAARVETVRVDPDSVQASYSKLTKYLIRPGWSTEPAGMDRLLARWRRHDVPTDPGEDSQVSVMWPSRDVDTARVFVAHGLHPVAVLAVRPTGSEPGGGSDAVRRARPQDAVAIAALATEEIAYEAGLSGLTLRPGFEAATVADVTAELAAPDPWTWVAESGGHVVGALRMQTPDNARRVGLLCSLSPVCYLGMLSVTAQHRGSGLGQALVHAALCRAGDAHVAACLLHYGISNPLSVPFWSRRGFRPLWTVFEAFPASTFR